ncbi:haloacid dehalogenase type II [Rugosimonospora acidiphila]|uniref:Haloacid dehalogenase type II n=2 Tax=Rugosimonospora acidiphila TaxID=556531 RepID=A0ABP9S8V2_9ACTN
MRPEQANSVDTGAPGQWGGPAPSVLVFDVNETLIDFDAMLPLFDRVFGDQRVLREWLGQLIMYSMTLTLSGLYEDYYSLGEGLLRMVGRVHGAQVTTADTEELRTGMQTMPAHPDVEEGLTKLRNEGLRMVTLTNSPPSPHGQTPLEHAGLAHFFERQFTIETARSYKPAPQVYHMVAQELAVPPSACLMVATHVWDTVGAQSAGFTAGLLTRPGNAPLPIPSLPQPNVIAPDLSALADKIIETRRVS